MAQGTDPAFRFQPHFNVFSDVDGILQLVAFRYNDNAAAFATFKALLQILAEILDIRLNLRNYYLFGAASHTALTPMTRQLNRVRLNAYDTEGYYNSGVLLMNLALQRQRLRAGDIFDYAERHRKKLILPDQDILNLMFWDSILPLDDSLYNFDARKSRVHYVVSSGVKDIDWVLANTVILHFCGRKKPWHKGYANRFEVLYKHYQHKAQRWAPQLKIRGGA
jgi:lipopolysaccharide biosynthesis glycosyltransferase